jgi:DNA-directed RNA polymerase, mitochondrial
MQAKLKGGYLSIHTQAVKAVVNPHTSGLERPVDGISLEALNWIQKTRWRINKPVLAVALAARDAALDLEGLPSAENVPLPSPLSQEAFAALTKEERVKRTREMEEIHARNAALAGRRAAVYRRLHLAADLAQFPTLWFPHSCDFRGRLYPTPQDLHPQGDTLTKGLLEFAEPVALGENGQWWLYVVLANSMGHDKLPLQHRADWTDTNLSTIMACAKDPMAFIDFWAGDDVDSPWEALALCFEVARLGDWIALGNNPQQFLSHAPVRLDATCSGIQHLSALMRDTVSARCVNVLPTGKREDIYSDVAKVVKERVALDAAAGNEFALGWLGKVERKTVKRAVMTTPYGVTPKGIADQLVFDKFCNHFPKDKRKGAAMYMKDCIVGALDVNIGQPRAAMHYMQNVARFLAEQDIPLQWTTPAGFTVRQAYFETDEKRIETLGGYVKLRVEKPEAGIVIRKQAAAAAPNVVHSFDAAHLCLTAVALKADGIRDLAFVHDSFGAHAGNADQLSLRLREQFVAMYGGSTLEDWRNSVIAHSGRDDIPPLPDLGDLDVSAALDSEFFFS